ncbi:hypothetical protein Lupro_06105 [Lutibacter profundi]|uniref:DUF3857 domain-containing protein n=1 Tax=Lutibacter profundi TaxID=1622118 RepID=A0A109RNK0_9FLAO|nr:DUF3857 domain-containing protein [Lutibacter profundi]AMC10840.1 hypothetical protein Lupro_06105 [Lutibacter profundi]
MKKKALTLLCTLLLTCVVYSQNYNFNSNQIPENLKLNANAVVVFDDVFVEIQNQKLMTVKVKKAVTILNKLGDKFRYVAVGFDKTRKIKNIETIIYDASGKEIKKVKNKEYKDVSQVAGGTLYADNRMLYYEHIPTAYPYTIYYEYEVNSPNTAFIRKWNPINFYSTGLVSATYTIIYANELNLQVKENNFEKFTIKKEVKENQILYTLSNIEPLKHEPLCPSLKKTRPNVQFVLNKFYAEGITGEANNWKELGKWEHINFYSGVGGLPEETKKKIKQLVQGVNSPIEKAKIVYKYVQDKTRYISVQVGIGGLRPMIARDVDNLGYGDCKALTNYTKSLLDVVGVKSYFTELYGGYEKINMDFNSPNIQGNHVILNVPIDNNDIWLECTSQEVPFGYIANFTDDRDVIVVKPEGGVLKRTKKYETTGNLQFSKGNYAIDAKGTMKASVSIESSGTQYNDNLKEAEGKSAKELKELFKEYLANINNIQFLNISVFNNKSEVKYEENLEFTAEDYALFAGKQMLIPINAFNKNSYVPKRVRNRKLPFEISRGFLDIDEVEIKLPSTFLVEYIPENIEIKTKFGTYSIELTKIDEVTYLYKRTLQIEEGKFSKDEYDAYRKFRKK